MHRPRWQQIIEHQTSQEQPLVQLRIATETLHDHSDDPDGGYDLTATDSDAHDFGDTQIKEISQCAFEPAKRKRNDQEALIETCMQCHRSYDPEKRVIEKHQAMRAAKQAEKFAAGHAGQLEP